MADTLVPDTSVLIDGRITAMVRERPGARVVVPVAALAELEAQANRGQETGVAGLDELMELQRLAIEGTCSIEFIGSRPTPAEMEAAASGAVDARIREAALEVGGTFVTSDRVQAHAAAAQGVKHEYLRPHVAEPDLSELALWPYFDETIMSVHLKADCVPMVKRGMPGSVSYEAAGTKEITHPELRALVRECIEFAKRDYNSFMELERHGCTVVQLGPMRVTIAQPPFSDGLEVTAVRPIKQTNLEDYELDPNIIERIETHSRGVFVAGPPGSGKSTFVAALGRHLHAMNRVVKTMEQPRDLVVPKEITQYGALDRNMKWTGEVMLLVRPDHVLYDEVRTTDDFLVFADMRMAGVGLFGVTHASRPIDAVQRLIGRVDLGVIPQVVDTILFIDAGRVETILELRFTVKVPEGMMEADLARPVVLVKNVTTGRDEYELYTYGEQIVVMPIEGQAQKSSGTSALAEKEVERALRRHVRGSMQINIRGNRATVMVEPWEVPAVIGKGGRTVQSLEQRLGISLDIKPLGESQSDARPKGRVKAQEAHIRKQGNNVYVMVDPADGGRTFIVDIEGSRVGEVRSSQEGKIRFKADSPEGQALLQAGKRGLNVNCIPSD